MPRKRVTYFLMLILLAGCGGKKTRLDPPGFKDMNIILVSLDTLRRDRLGSYGCPLPASPFLDRFSREATVFQDVISQCPSTATSHRSLFSSRYPHMFIDAPPVAAETMAGMLHRGGWQTAAFTDGGMMSRKFGHDAGFESYSDRYLGTRRNLELARKWLKDHAEQKFFLFLHTYEIHSPYYPPKPFREYFAGDYHSDLDLRKTEHFRPNTLTNEDYAYISGMYNGDLRSCEGKFQQFMYDLDAMGLLKKTIVIFMSDHGESLGERGYVGHNMLYNVQLEVPLILRLPCRQTPLVEGLLENVDLLPTLLHLVGLRDPGGLVGIDLTDTLFHRPGISRNRSRLSETAVMSVRSADQWRLILRNSPDTDELYYLPDDPEETRNLATLRPEKTHDLRQILTRRVGRSLAEMRMADSGLRERKIIRKVNQDGAADNLRNELSALGYIDDTSP